MDQSTPIPHLPLSQPSPAHPSFLCGVMTPALMPVGPGFCFTLGTSCECVIVIVIVSPAHPLFRFRCFSLSFSCFLPLSLCVLFFHKIVRVFVPPPQFFPAFSSSPPLPPFFLPLFLLGASSPLIWSPSLPLFSASCSLTLSFSFPCFRVCLCTSYFVFDAVLILWHTLFPIHRRSSSRKERKEKTPA